MANMRKPNEGKLGPNWEGPYKVWMLKFSAPNGPRIDPRTGWTRAKFVCVGDVEPKTLLQVW
jgi:hypothetical protein